jgi:hypothetical protein
MGSWFWSVRPLREPFFHLCLYTRHVSPYVTNTLLRERTQFVIPILLDRLGWGAFVFFGALNIVAIPLIYFFYPEVAKRSLEEINLLFTSDTLFVKANMREYDRRIDAASGSIAVAARNLLAEVDGHSTSYTQDISDVEKRGDSQSFAECVEVARQ